jgi:CTP:phosphocholine cytidylyltransferase-like protein
MHNFTYSAMNVVIPLAGKSSRFYDEGFKTPKYLLPLHNGETMIEGAVKSLHMNGTLIFVVQRADCEKYSTDTLLKEKFPDSIITYLDYYTGGCVETVYVACKDLINSDTPLVISNCDQFLEWDSTGFMDVCNNPKTDGCVLTYFADTTKNSYVRLNSERYAEEFREKIVISKDSLVGVHYWKRGSDFIDSAEHMIQNNVKDSGEFYVSISYNYLVKKGMRIYAHPMAEGETYHTIGVPSTYYEFLQKKKPIDLVPLTQMTRGWFIGDFTPSVFRTPDVEVGLLSHSKGEMWGAHLHKRGTEYNCLVSGKMLINGITIEPGTIFTVPTGLLTKAVFLEDCKVVCVKVPSDTKDKYNY